MRRAAATTPRRSAEQTREHILEVTHDLFYWHGIRATGVDQIAQRAGVAPTTLYRAFASKDDLVTAYVERADRLYREWFEATLEEAGPDPRSRIVHLFDAQLEQVDPSRCRGCPFLMVLAEIPEVDLPAHRHAVASRVWVRDAFRRLTSDLAEIDEIDDPEALADQLMLLFEGVYATAASVGRSGPTIQARAVVQALLPEERPRRGAPSRKRR
jgi:AcrR family transcriptional regulator